jgi:PhnB protein
MAQNPKIPANNQTVMPYLILRDAEGFMKFTQEVFGATLLDKHLQDDGTIMHAEVMIGDSTIMFAQSNDKFGESPAGLFIYVNDTDETYIKALEFGATSVQEISDQSYGRTGGIKDANGNTWWITSIK